MHICTAADTSLTPIAPPLLAFPVPPTGQAHVAHKHLLTLTNLRYHIRYTFACHLLTLYCLLPTCCCPLGHPHVHVLLPRTARRPQQLWRAPDRGPNPGQHHHKPCRPISMQQQPCRALVLWRRGCDPGLCPAPRGLHPLLHSTSAAKPDQDANGVGPGG